MENLTRYDGNSLPHFPAPKTRRSGYEPSDTETDWQDSPWRDHNGNNRPLVSDLPRSPVDPTPKISPMRSSRRHSSRIEYDISSSTRASGTSPARRRHSKSPYKPHKGEAGSNIRRNVSPMSKSDRWRHNYPHKLAREENAILEIETLSSNRKQNHRMNDKHTDSQLHEFSRTSERSNTSRRSVSAPRAKPKTADGERQINYGLVEQKNEVNPPPPPPPLSKRTVRKQIESPPKKGGPSVSEINVMAANARLARGGARDISKFDSTDSILPGDIFFSRDFTDLSLQKNVLKKSDVENRLSSAPNPHIITQRNLASNQKTRGNDVFYQSIQGNSSSTVLSGTTTSSMVGTESSKTSDASGSLKKFTANRRKSHSDAWFACMKKGPCKTRKSPKKREVDESSFIQKALVVENLRQFWADKHQPTSLNSFMLHKQEAQLLQQLVS